MKSVFLLQWQRFRREPFLTLAFFVLTVVFVFFIAGFSSEGRMTVYTYSDLSDSETNDWLTKLNESDTFQFKVLEEVEAKKLVANGEISLALRLMKDNYRILIATDQHTRIIIENYLNDIFSEELRLKEFETLGAGDQLRTDVNHQLIDPVLTVVTSTLEGEALALNHDDRFQPLFGMTLYFSIFTIMFSLMKVAEEKSIGTWDRLVLSPLRKWQLYLGHLLYCFTIGYAQILTIFLFFQYALDIHLGNRFGTILVVIGCFTFAIVSLGMLVIGLVKSSQQLQAVIPIVGTAMAMVGGAFWPIEVVTNEIMLFLSKGMPTYYGLEALRGATIYNHGVLDIIEPLSILLLFGVICMGLGINLIERRKS